MAVDLLFGRVGVACKKRVFNLREDLLGGKSEQEIISRYRFGSESIEYLTNLLKPDIERQTARNHALQPKDQILVALRFLASGGFLETIGDTVGGIPKCTVSRIVSRVAIALASKHQDFIKWPSETDKLEIKHGFYEKGGFPNVVGCIDGTHVRIQRPSVDENDFVNRKGFHSINVQAVCDHKGLFTNVVARWPGSTHDSFILSNSVLNNTLETSTVEDGFVLGDSGYPLKRYLITPYPEPICPKQEAFNKAHMKTRVAIEQTFGRWKRRFHLLHSEIRMKPQKVCILIGACAVLHNIAILRNEVEFETEGMDGNEQPDCARYDGPDEGKVVREYICNRFF